MSSLVCSLCSQRLVVNTGRAPSLDLATQDSYREPSAGEREGHRLARETPRKKQRQPVLAAEPLHPAMRQWATAGLPVPQLGFELADDNGEVLAEAELAWPTERVAVLHGEQAENGVVFEQAGWRV